MLNSKQQADERFILERTHKVLRNNLIMGDTSIIKFLSGSEIQLFHEAQEFLLLDSEDIRFRTYDLLFACYPALRSQLTTDRYKHPDIVALLYNNPEDISVGIEASRFILSKLAPKSDGEFINSASLIKHCIIKAIRDVLFDELSPELLQAYSKIIEQRMLDLIESKSDYCNDNNNFGDSRSATS